VNCNLVNLMNLHGAGYWVASSAPINMITLEDACLNQKELADGPALRPDGPRSGQSAPVGRTVRAGAEQIRVPSFVLRVLAIFAELARNQLCKGSSPPSL
jgi:hypothetical protein